MATVSDDLYFLLTTTGKRRDFTCMFLFKDTEKERFQLLTGVVSLIDVTSTWCHLGTSDANI